MTMAITRRVRQGLGSRTCPHRGRGTRSVSVLQLCAVRAGSERAAWRGSRSCGGPRPESSGLWCEGMRGLTLKNRGPRSPAPGPTAEGRGDGWSQLQLIPRTDPHTGGLRAKQPRWAHHCAPGRPPPKDKGTARHWLPDTIPRNSAGPPGTKLSPLQVTLGDRPNLG